MLPRLLIADDAMLILMPDVTPLFDYFFRRFLLIFFADTLASPLLSVFFFRYAVADALLIC